mgnify:CR=1 FL=1
MISSIDEQAVEQAGFRSWPARETLEHSGLLLRCADGYTKRANSINALRSVQGDYVQILSDCEKHFQAWALPLVFRLPSFTDNSEFDQFLESNHYKKIDESLVMTLDFDTGIELEAERIESVDLDRWLKAFCDISPGAYENFEAHKEILSRVSDEVLFAVSWFEGKPQSCGLGVLSEGHFGLFDLVTRNDRRRMGHSRRLLQQMMAWAAQRSAQTAYMQVLGTNAAAIALYRGLGFQEAYHYWYRKR